MKYIQIEYDAIRIMRPRQYTGLSILEFFNFLSTHNNKKTDVNWYWSFAEICAPASIKLVALF